MSIRRYAGDKIVGLSSDTKPVNVSDGATFYETDTLKEYIKNFGSWTRVANTNFTSPISVGEVSLGNTSITFGASGLSFSNGSSNSVFVSANGNVGIGTTTPTTPLQIALNTSNLNQIGSQITVAGNPLISLGERENVNYGGMLKVHDGIGSTGYAMLEYNGGYPQIRTNRNNFSINFSGGSFRANHAYFDYSTSSGTKFFVAAAGNAGIGTTSPLQKLDVAGNQYLRNSTTPTLFAAYNTYTDGSNYERGVFDWSTTSNVLRIGTEAAGTGTVRNIAFVGGNIGIGTTSPSYKLDIIQSSGSSTFRLGSDTTNYMYIDSGGVETHIYSVGARPFKLASNGNTNQLVLASSGNVGIGTDTPTAKLDINSDAIRIRTSKTPASATAEGNQGDVCWDSGYIYVCTAANTWVRAALSSW